MFNAIAKSWIPSAGGALTFLSVLIGQLMLNFDDDPKTNANWMMVLAAAGTMLGLASARQSNVSDEQAGAGRTGSTSGYKFGMWLPLLLLVSISSAVYAAPPEANKIPTFLAQQSLGSTNVERPATPAKAKASVSSEMERMKSRRPEAGFRDALIEAAKQAREEGQISRWELTKIRVATLRNSELVKECQDYIMEEAKAQGALAAGDGAIDWSNLIAFIKEWLPRILELISLFMNDDTASFYRHQLTPFTESTYSLVA